MLGWGLSGGGGGAYKHNVTTGDCRRVFLPVRVMIRRFLGFRSAEDDEELVLLELVLLELPSLLESLEIARLQESPDGLSWLTAGPSRSDTSKVISKMSDILIGADVGICSKLIARLGNDTLSPMPFILH